MSEIKVSLSLELQGSTMLSEQECSRNSKKKKDCYDYFRMEVADANGKNKEAYDYMTDSRICPDPKLKKGWESYSIQQRLEYHCGQIAGALGAIGFSFEVLDD